MSELTTDAHATELTGGLRAEAAELLPELTALRRELHAHPETGTELPRTQRRLLGALDRLPLDITLGEGLSSIVAVLRGGHPGPTVLLRSDMDGLPLTEQTGLPYRSENGAMHACGHDLHMAGLIGAAKLLAARQDQLPGNVILMFQPAEETLQGAKMMLAEGLLNATGEHPVAAYGIHVAPGPRGHFGLSSGISAAGSNRLTLTVDGKGGHGSRPHETVDPVPILAEIILALQSLVTRQMDAQDPVVLSITTLQAGTVGNIIPAQASAGGTIRNLSEDSLKRLTGRVNRLVRGIAEAHGASATAEIIEGCPALVNDEALTNQSTDVLTRMFGETRVTRADASLAVMGSEDFAFIAREVPASFFRLLASPEKIDPSTLAYNHSPLVQFDDSILGDHAAALAALAIDRLQRG
ncbi:M20 family metallopeptidase [Arthrobacter sp. M4]|uniref:M20 metallopeptidase family protein n=1 Tax=Arthrobacter sp. M4 TaxID=218160 RepID=UPI001CDC6FE8|nr:M20 family metallopeptidase [Arthrobacter sp. M4]MCA4135291.1 M20 family metallopeptidase [Arthrobacter sp. M4]